MPLSINELKTSKNVAEMLDENQLSKVSSQVSEGLKIDEASLSDWSDTVEKAMDIAKQTIETKNHPWPSSSNVKYPLITQAAIDFAARIYPEIIQNHRVVKAEVIGRDEDGEKLKRGERVARFSSYQLLTESDSWEDGVDKLLHILPIVGTVFKKTYFHPFLKRPISELCPPDRVVVNYNAPSLEEARRVSHLLELYSNDVMERIRSGLFLDVDIEELKASDGYEDEDQDSPLEVIEQHCYLDLDEDGYQEPYIVTMHKATRQVLRIVSRFKKVEKNSAGEVQRIEPEQYFTDFHYIRSPDGGFYSMGIGTLLYPLNAAVNTLINQLVDAGTLNNSQGGFIGRGIRIKAGEFKLKLGEWKMLDSASGINLRENIVPLPTKEPSDTLFKLLGLLIESAKDLVSTNDLMQGKGQTQNVPATTVLTMVEQGMKVFNAINKRLYRSLKKEFSKIYGLNRRFLDPNHYHNVLDDPEANFKLDFDIRNVDISPVADPNMATGPQRIAKAQALLQVPGVDPYESTRYYLESLQVDTNLIDKLLPKPDPNAPPPPEVQKLMAETKKFEAQANQSAIDSQVTSQSQLFDAEKIKVQAAEAESRIRESEARIRKMEQDAQNNATKVELAIAKSALEAELKEANLEHTREKDEVELSIKAVESAAKLAEEKEDSGD